MQGSVGHLIWTICYLSVLLVLSAYGIHRYFIVYLFLKNRKRETVPVSRFVQLPKVTMQLPIFNEVYVVERLLKSVSEIDYPRDLLQIQVLDDSTDDTRELTARCVNELQGRGFNVQLIHRVDRVGFKAGALETGLGSAEGDFVCILDADFVPPPDLLHNTVHFFTDPKVGMIQTRWGHLNRTYSLLTRVQAMFLDGHLLLEQTARSRSGRFFNFNGTAGLWRRTCIAEAGGWQHDTLTEDLDLSYRAQLAGWKFIFLPNVITPAELPVDMNGFKSQQHRWTKGSIQTCKKLLPTIWRSALPFYLKLEATAHLTSNFAYLLLAFLCVLLHPSIGGPQNSWMRTLLVDVPIFLTASLSVAVFYICAQRELHPRTWMKEILLLPALLALGVGLSLNNARAVLEAVFNHRSDFARTPKYGIERKKQAWRSYKYMPLKSLLPIAEMAFALYFTYVVWFAIRHGQYFSVPFLAMFQIGFLYVSLSSLSQWWPRFALASARGDHHSGVTTARNLLKNARMFRQPALLLSSLLLLRSLHAEGLPEVKNEVIVSVKDQRLMLLQNGAQVTTYPVSTSKFGVGDASGRMTTPLGAMAVAQKIGDHAPTGAVFHNRRFTGEILKPNAPGRDPIITRIIWLRGLEASTSRAFSRCIYIHGTPEEKKIGQPASYGCIRMKSKDVTALYSQLPIGAVVQVLSDKLPRVPKAKTVYQIKAPDAPVEVGRPAPFVRSNGSTRKL